MAYLITDLTGTTVPAGGAFPFGDVVDAPNGTVVDKKMVTDLLQTVQKMFDYISVVPNSTPDGFANGYQIFDALLYLILTGIAQPQSSVIYSGTYTDDLTSPIKVRLIGDKCVHIKGRTNNSAPTGGISTDQTVFVLSIGLRPLEDQVFICADVNTPSPVFVKIEAATGNVVIMGTLAPFDNTGVYLNISFDTD